MVSGAPDRYFTSTRYPRIHHFIQPRNRNRPERVATTGKPFAMDNDAFLGFNPPAFRKMLDAYAHLAGECIFCTVPDSVADHRATLELWKMWAPIVATEGFPPAFVLQDGATPAEVPWSELGAVFVGGSTEWKESPEAARIAREAKERGIWVHWGRVNTRSRIRHIVPVGADSIDGTGCSRFPDAKIPVVYRWLAVEGRSQSILDVGGNDP